VSLQGIIRAKPQVGNSRKPRVFWEKALGRERAYCSFFRKSQKYGDNFSHEVSLLSYHINSLSHDEGSAGAP
jgi:hypothetical protein